jgi:hypothetical protein
LRIEKAVVEEYRASLKDKHRPPSRGGNTRAWHRHVLVIAGEQYSFLAANAGKFVYKDELVIFDWEWDQSGRYRNIDRKSVVAWDASGCPVIRGNRDDKTWRTADTRLPGRDD